MKNTKYAIWGGLLLKGLLTLLLLILAGCAGLPEKRELAKAKTLDQYAAARSFDAAAREWPADQWWKAYGDPQLDALIAEGLAGSPTLASAEARLQRARAFMQVADAALKPQVSANASITEAKQSRNYLTPSQLVPEGWNDYGRATLDFSWEIDFWGKNRAALAAATSEAEAAAADRAQARITLATSIASAYAELARLQAALDTAKSAQEVRTRTASLFRQRHDNGLETLGSVRSAEARRAAAEADTLSLAEQLALQKNRIAALLGAGPDRGLAIEAPKISLAQTFGLPGSLPAELLGRRPDVAAARLRAEAAAKRIDQARAAFYPNVNLAAFVGRQSLGLDRLTSENSAIGSIGPAVSLPIFDGGRLRGQLRTNEADYLDAIASYEKAVVQALQDVADAAVSQKALGGQIARTDEAVALSREAWRIQNNRYNGGLSTYLDVLSAEETLLANLRSQSDLNSRSFALDVALVRALGGGYTTQSN